MEIAEATRKAAIVEKIVWGGAGALGVAFIFLGLLRQEISGADYRLQPAALFDYDGGLRHSQSAELDGNPALQILRGGRIIKSISAAIAYQRVETASGRDADRFDADIRQPQPIRRTRQTAVETEREPPLRDIYFRCAAVSPNGGNGRDGSGNPFARAGFRSGGRFRRVKRRAAADRRAERITPIGRCSRLRRGCWRSDFGSIEAVFFSRRIGADGAFDRKSADAAALREHREHHLAGITHEPMQADIWIPAR